MVPATAITVGGPIITARALITAMEGPITGTVTAEATTATTDPIGEIDIITVITAAGIEGVDIITMVGIGMGIANHLISRATTFL